MPDWTFITRHAVALSLIATHPRITALALGVAMDITERSVRKLIADLCAAGYIRKKREGRGVIYRINADLPLRQESHREIAIGDFLKTLGWKRRQESKKPQSEKE